MHTYETTPNLAPERMCASWQAQHGGVGKEKKKRIFACSFSVGSHSNKNPMKCWLGWRLIIILILFLYLCGPTEKKCAAQLTWVWVDVDRPSFASFSFILLRNKSRQKHSIIMTINSSDEKSLKLRKLQAASAKRLIPVVPPEEEVCFPKKQKKISWKISGKGKVCVAVNRNIYHQRGD